MTHFRRNFSNEWRKRRPPPRLRKGQALVEFVSAFALLAITVFGCGSLLMATWNRTRCAYLAYETAHAHLTGSRPPGAMSRASTLLARSRIQEDPESVGVELLCGAAKEQVRLFRLEAGP